MADSRFASQQSSGPNTFKEAVCINADRIYDSCSDKDCLEDLQVYFTPLNQAIINNATSVKNRSVTVYTVLMDVEPVPFNKGFYSVDMSFYFLVKLEAVVSPLTPPARVDGICVFTKKVILYGSEGSVQMFASDTLTSNTPNTYGENIPTANVAVVNPICLECRLCDAPSTMHDVNFCCPSVVSDFFDDEFDVVNPQKVVSISIGLFSICQLVRTVQMMVPVYDYCIPDKECMGGADEPCEIFKKIKFPVNEFFPPRLGECGCNEN